MRRAVISSTMTRRAAQTEYKAMRIQTCLQGDAPIAAEEVDTPPSAFFMPSDLRHAGKRKRDTSPKRAERGDASLPGVAILVQ